MGIRRGESAGVRVELIAIRAHGVDTAQSLSPSVTALATKRKACAVAIAPQISSVIRQANKQTPPVIDQRHRTRSKLAAMQIVRGETTPAPLILQLVEGIRRIRPITVQLA